MLHPSSLIREKWSNTHHMERVEGMVLVFHEYCVVRWGSPETNAIIMMHPDLPNKEIYVTHRMVQITEEGP